MLIGKAVYGDPWGLLHSLLHGMSTLIVLAIALAFGAPYWILVMGLVDFFVHYHVDFIKARFGPKDPFKPIYWKWHGIDQLLHYLTYLIIIIVVL